MIGVVIVAHGDQAGAQLRVAKELVRGLEGVVAVDLPPGAGPQAIRAKLGEAIEAVRGEDGVLILVDLFGSTPASCALGFQEPGRVEVVTGFNLPMLLHLDACRRAHPGLVEVAEELVAYGKRNVVHASAAAAGRSSRFEPPAPEPSVSPGEDGHRGRFRVVNRLGLHARAAARLVQLANRFSSEISLHKNDQLANAKSIMGVLMLAAAQGTELEVRTRGPDAGEALEAIGALIAAGFGEDRGEEQGEDGGDDR